MTDRTTSRLPSKQSRRRRGSWLLGSLLLLGASLSAAGCLQRPVEEQHPTTSNVFVTQIPFSEIDKIDLLFVVDNSVSMADKQALLRDAVPTMVARLVTPDCVNDAGDRQPSTGGTCAGAGAGYALEFQPVNDIHIGVISSSLGAFGADKVCDQGDDTDKSLLIPKVRPDAPNPTGLGFLVWNGPEEGTVEDLRNTFQGQIEAVGETGCGFEAPLEAWYRFLVDPSPPASLTLGDDNIVRSNGPDGGILDQRSEFLRPDSLVAIVVLTDENDCSGMEGGGYYANAGFGWLVPSTGRTFETASTACAENPNDPCCYSCLQKTPPAGCTDTCTRGSNGNGAKLSPDEDRANVRCFQNKRRFGLDLLYPTSRYVDGLTKAVIVDTQATTNPNQPVTAQNPLLQGRRPDLIFFAGIVGVPWQDIATEQTRGADVDRLEYLRADQLRRADDALQGKNRWSLILGEPNLPASSPECSTGNPNPPPECGVAPVLPLDPFMIEAIDPRSGTNPITGDAIIPPGGNGWSPINGSEYNNDIDVGDGEANDDLQYSCIFPLSADAVKVDCDPSNAACDCGAEPNKGSPLCKPVGSQASATATTTQYWGKAYPATRILRVLRDFGDNSIVGSICPKIIDDTTSPYYGYNPAVNAIVDRLKEKLGGTCLPRELSVTDEGTLPCAIVEAIPGQLDCNRQGRSPVDPQVRRAAIALLADTGYCTDDPSQAGSSIDCESYGMCAINEVENKAPCFGTTGKDDQPAGWCYIDPAKGPTAGGEGCDGDDPATWASCTNTNVTRCPATQRRILRFVGQNTPINNSNVFVACTGDATTDTGGQLGDLPSPGGSDD